MTAVPSHQKLNARRRGIHQLQRAYGRGQRFESSDRAHRGNNAISGTAYSYNNGSNERDLNNDKRVSNCNRMKEVKRKGSYTTYGDPSLNKVCLDEVVERSKRLRRRPIQYQVIISYRCGAGKRVHVVRIPSFHLFWEQSVSVSTSPVPVGNCYRFIYV